MTDVLQRKTEPLVPSFCNVTVVPQKNSGEQIKPSKCRLQVRVQEKSAGSAACPTASHLLQPHMDPGQTQQLCQPDPREQGEGGSRGHSRGWSPFLWAHMELRPWFRQVFSPRTGQSASLKLPPAAPSQRWLQNKSWLQSKTKSGQGFLPQCRIGISKLQSSGQILPAACFYK